MGVLKEKLEWTAPIYSIERTDPLMGGELGVNNKQAQQLANRTQVLRALLSEQHGTEGGHTLSQDDVAEGAGIAERKLALSTSTGSIYARVEAALANVRELMGLINNSQGAEGTPFNAIYQALLLSWEFGAQGYAFDLFNKAFSLLSSVSIPVLETITGDDSVDVASTEDIEVGDVFLLDATGDMYTVVSVLTENRILLDRELDVDLKNSGHFVKTTWNVSEGSAHAEAGTMYITEPVHVEATRDKSRLFICHAVGNLFTVDYRVEETSDWRQAGYVRSELAEGLAYTVYEVSTNGAPFELRITAVTGADIDHLCVMPAASDVQLGMVRVPEAKGDFAVARFGALYDAKYGGTEFRIASDPDMSNILSNPVFSESFGNAAIWDFKSLVHSMYVFTLGRTYYWQARQCTSDGHWSEWSLVSAYTPSGAN